SKNMVNGTIYTLPYDLKNEFDPIALLAQAPQMIVAKKSIPANDLKSLLAWLKDTPNVTMGTSGIGSPPHIGGVLFQNMTGIKAQFVSYRGASLSMQDLVAGQIDMMISDTTTAPPQARVGNIKAYAIAGPARLPAAPETPTPD